LINIIQALHFKRVLKEENRTLVIKDGGSWSKYWERIMGQSPVKTGQNKKFLKNGRFKSQAYQTDRNQIERLRIIKQRESHYLCKK